MSSRPATLKVLTARYGDGLRDATMCLDRFAGCPVCGLGDDLYRPLALHDDGRLSCLSNCAHDSIAAALGSPGDAAKLDPTDAGNAQRLAALAVDELRAVTGAGWIVWDGHRWAPDDSEDTAATRCALRAARAISDECDVLRAEGADDNAVRARYGHFLRSQSRPRLEAMLKLARVELQAHPEDLDADPDVLNTPTGVVELHSGDVRPHDRRDLITRTTRVIYDPDAAAPAWDAFLEEVLPDEELRAFMRRAAGYLLTGRTDEQVFFVLNGSGANGKSVLVRTLHRVLGDYATSAAAETFMVSRRGGGDTRSDLVRLRGARLVSTSETSDGLRFDDRLVKEVTGGESITARALYSPEVTFTPRFKLLVSCNALPRFDGADYAMRRRLRVVPFSVQIPAERQDPALAAKLAAEAPGILAWAAQGAREWYEQGLGTCGAVEAASALSAADMDPVGMFLDERCSIEPAAFTTSSAIATAYSEWAAANKQPDLGAKKLGDSLGRHGLTNGKRSGKRGWNGVRIAAEEQSWTDVDGSSRHFPAGTNYESSGTIRPDPSMADEQGVFLEGGVA